jgi:hypothetical protein
MALIQISCKVLQNIVDMHFHSNYRNGGTERKAQTHTFVVILIHAPRLGPEYITWSLSACAISGALGSCEIVHSH